MPSSRLRFSPSRSSEWTLNLPYSSHDTGRFRPSSALAGCATYGNAEGSRAEHETNRVTGLIYRDSGFANTTCGPASLCNLICVNSGDCFKWETVKFLPLCSAHEAVVHLSHLGSLSVSLRLVWSLCSPESLPAPPLSIYTRTVVWPGADGQAKWSSSLLVTHTLR